MCVCVCVCVYVCVCVCVCACVCVRQVPKTIPAWQAAFIEPLACSVHAVELGNIGFGDTVVVAGCGPLGLGMVAAARLKNPASLIALDLYDWKVAQSILLVMVSSFIIRVIGFQVYIVHQ